MTDESYTHTLCEQYLRDECRPGFANLDAEERAGVLAEIIRDDPSYAVDLMHEACVPFPAFVADILDARSEGKWGEIADIAQGLGTYLAALPVHAEIAIEQALDAAFEQAEQDARERFEEDDGRGDYLYQVRKDDALTGDA